MSVGRPYVSCHARTRWSDAAFDAEYGECGAYGVFSVKKPSAPSEPYTSSVEMCWKRNARRAASSSVRQWASAAWRSVAVPVTFVRMNSPGPSIERSTCDSAARWKTVSGRNSANALSIAATSQMSACRKE